MAGGISYKTPAFEGPLDLLLYLIQKSEVNIYDIPISEITDQFLSYLKNEEVSFLGDLTDFYKMAADLLWIKSRMLLPVEIEFDEEYEDPRKELVQRLLDYQKFKKYSQLLFDSEKQNDFSVERKKMQFLLPFSDQELWSEVEAEDLLETFVGLLRNVDEFSQRVFSVYEEVSVGEKIALIEELLEKENEVHFLDIVVNKQSSEHIISAFLAILDCVKDKMILIKQDVLFGDILITKRPMDFVEDADET